jgi:hypothetical protein
MAILARSAVALAVEPWQSRRSLHSRVVTRLWALERLWRGPGRSDLCLRLSYQTVS